MRFSLEKLAGRIVRRTVAATTLLAYLMAAIGFPVPETSASASTHACGRRVCSHSTARPALPPTHEPRPENSNHTESSGSDPSSCCKRGPRPTQSPLSSAQEFVASAKRAQDTSSTSPAKGISIRWLVGMSALKCQSGSTSWLSLPAATVPSPRFCWHVDYPYCHAVPAVRHIPFVERADPVDPPPRPVGT
jgi:hypothetical protein